MHELGGALFAKKAIISILCGISARQLPEWIQDRQAIDLRKKEQIVSTVQKIATKCRLGNFLAGMIAMCLIGFALWLFFGRKK
jgi:hypothetical protein